MSFQENLLKRLLSIIKGLLFLAAIYYILIFIFLAFFRIPYPFELEWLEGNMLEHVLRVLDGEKLYVEPSLSFISCIYTPLYYYLAALLSLIMGKGFLSLRFLSFTATLGTFFIIYRLIKRETSSIFTAIIAVGLYAATYQLSGAWFDIARNDALGLFLALVTIYILRFNSNPKGYFLSGLFMSLAIFTRQTFIILFIPLTLYVILTGKRRCLYFIGSTILITGLGTLVLNSINNGWFFYYTCFLSMNHEFVPSVLTSFWTTDILAPLTIAFTLGILYLYNLYSEKQRTNLLFYILVFIGMTGASWIARLHIGGWNNVLMPAYAVVAILFGLGAHWLMVRFTFSSLRQEMITRCFIGLTFLAQFYFLMYDPLTQLPSQKDLEAGNRLLETVSSFEGEVLIPYHGYLNTMAGKKSHFHNMAMIDIIRGDPVRKEKLYEDIETALSEKRYDAIIINAAWFSEQLEKYYEYRGEVFQDNHVFKTVTGFRTRPEYIYIPKK